MDGGLCHRWRREGGNKDAERVTLPRAENARGKPATSKARRRYGTQVSRIQTPRFALVKKVHAALTNAGTYYKCCEAMSRGRAVSGIAMLIEFGAICRAANAERLRAPERLPHAGFVP
jgi:hypothetical protein